MAETTSNIEFAHKIHEQAVAVLTAWSGYQAAKWDAESAEAYARASSTTVAGQEQQTLAGQDHLYDIVTFAS